MFLKEDEYTPLSVPFFLYELQIIFILCSLGLFFLKSLLSTGSLCPQLILLLVGSLGNYIHMNCSSVRNLPMSAESKQSLSVLLCVIMLFSESPTYYFCSSTGRKNLWRCLPIMTLLQSQGQKEISLTF